MSDRGMGRLAHLTKGLIALVVLAALVAGVPWALWHYIGWPLPHHVPTATQIGHALDRRGIPARSLVDALAVVVWITWAVLVASVAAEIPAALAGRHAQRLPLAGVFQPLTGRLVAAVVVAGLSLAPRPAHSASAGSPGAGQVALRRPVAALVLTGDRLPGLPPDRPPRPPAADTSATGIAAPAAPAAGATKTYVVQRGDTLWGIAERQLGDPLRWSQIYALNDGRPQPGGATLTDPHWIDPGWTLLVPILPSTPPSPAVPPSPTPPPPPPARRPASPASTTAPGPPVAPRDTRGPAHTPGSAALSEVPLSLPSGEVIAGSFAAGVLSAVAAGRLRRRRSYRPSRPRPGVHLTGPGRPQGLADLLATVRAGRQDDDRDLSEATPPAPPPLGMVPDDEAIARPDLADVAHRGGRVVRVALGDWPGVRLSGPGATAALRAWLASLVTRAGPYAAEVLVPAALAEELFPGVRLPSVRRFEGLDALLTALETAAIGRTRRLEEAEVTDAATYRSRFPEDPFPLHLAVVAEAIPAQNEARWSAVLASAKRLGFAVVITSAQAGDDPLDPDGPRLVVGDDGTVVRAAPGELAEVLAGASAFQLDSATAADLLGPVAAVHNDTEPDQPDQPDGLGAGFEGHEAANDATVTAGPAMVEGGEPRWPVGSGDRLARRAPIGVRLLGPARVEAWGEEITSGLRSSAYELLAWYALRPGGASAEAAIDALWPAADARRGRERFWTALGNLRSRLHGPGSHGVEIVTKSGECYRPDPVVLDVDLWRFEVAIADAARAGAAPEALDALERCVGAYGGDFCPGVDALWVEPVREDLHRRALDAHLRLAELYADDQPERALGVLEATIELDSICEDAYRRLIALQARLGRRDASKRTWALLQGRLAELDLEAEESTERLVHELTSGPTTIRRLPARR